MISFRNIVVVACVALCTLPARAAAPPRSGQPAPTFTAKTLDDKKLVLSTYRGKPVYLDFFASWCAPCREETPSIVKFSKRYAKRGLVIIGLNDDGNSDRAEGFRDQYKIPFPIVIADQKLLDTYGIIALPVHVFIDRKGNIKTYRLGEMSSQQIETAIQSIL
ncbi:MAG: TlpA family protein disulfide reductase [Vulcanimicrobiaceae bacterium]